MKIEIFGTPTCSACREAKSFLDVRGWDYTYHDLTTMPPADAQKVLDISGMRTVPIVTIDGDVIGGRDQLIEFISSEERN